MKKFLKWILAGILTAGSIAMCVSAYGKFSDSVTVTNHISTGDINISMKELEKRMEKKFCIRIRKWSFLVTGYPKSQGSQIVRNRVG